MDGTLGLLGGTTGAGGSTTGSASTVSKEDNLVMSSEVSSPYPDETELELGLGLSLGVGGGGLGSNSKPAAAPWGQYARILTAKDFPSLVSKSSSTSSSSVTKANSSTAGTKRSASDSVSPRNGTSQVVGWPPLRTYRMNSMATQAKASTAEDFSSPGEENESKNAVVDRTTSGSNKNPHNAKEKRFLKTSLFVKVNMDGVGIGRKVDLNAHNCYENLAETLDDMFCRPTTTITARRSSVEENDMMTEASGPSKLLDGSSEFVLTYEDKEGDWMLVGDVPWGMFLNSVKRLRIMRTSEANGL
ncbi:hypothetical protein RJ640_002603, partial [Escallonia rubra]